MVKEIRSLQEPSDDDTHSAKLDAVLGQLSKQRRVDRPEDIKAIFSSLRARGGMILFTEDQAGKLWSHLLQAPIDQEMLDDVDILSKHRVPGDQSTAIMNGLLDHFDKESEQGTVPQTTNHHHYLLLPARMLKNLAPTERRAAAERIVTMLESANPSRLDKNVINRTISQALAN
jgi:hypothetical protein